MVRNRIKDVLVYAGIGAISGIGFMGIVLLYCRMAGPLL